MSNFIKLRYEDVTTAASSISAIVSVMPANETVELVATIGSTVFRLVGERGKELILSSSVEASQLSQKLTAHGVIHKVSTKLMNSSS